MYKLLITSVNQHVKIGGIVIVSLLNLLYLLLSKWYIRIDVKWFLWKASVILLSHVMLIGFPAVRRLWDIKIQQKRVMKLATILAQIDKTWMSKNENRDHEAEREYNNVVEIQEIKDLIREDGPPPLITSSSDTPLISAARNGITEIVEVILKRYPQAIECRNDRLENILHVAARYRRKKNLGSSATFPGSSAEA